MEKAHLDITHYDSLSMEQTEKLEEMANRVVKRAVPVTKAFMSRGEAEKKHGMRIYQGGAIPDRRVRIVSTPGWDVEACAGTHLSNTKETGKIVIVSTERIQDGVDRITLKAGPAAQEHLDNVRSAASKMAARLEKSGILKLSGRFSVDDEFRLLKDVRRSAAVFAVGMEQLERTVDKFCTELESLHGKLGRKVAKPKSFNDLHSALTQLFHEWKAAKKRIEENGLKVAEERSGELIAKSRNGMLFEVIEGHRKDLIKTASNLIKQDPKLTVILANPKGDVVGMSRTKDVCSLVGGACSKAGGAGGGKGELAQGRADIKRLKKVIGSY
jgi:alanyl-tRNA synthetase